jgi:hypothetical protein
MASENIPRIIDFDAKTGTYSERDMTPEEVAALPAVTEPLEPE